MADDEKSKTGEQQSENQNGQGKPSGDDKGAGTTQKVTNDSEKAQSSAKAPKEKPLIPGGDARSYAELYLFSDAMRDIANDGPVMQTLRRRTNLSEEDRALIDSFNGGAVGVSKFMKVISRFYNDFGFNRPMSESDLRKYYVYGKSIASKNGKILTEEEVNQAKADYDSKKQETTEDAKNKKDNAEKGYKVAKSEKRKANWKTRFATLGVAGSALLALAIPGLVFGGVVAIATVPAISIGWMTGGGLALFAGGVVALRYVFPRTLKLFSKAWNYLKDRWAERMKAREAKRDAKKLLKKAKAQYRSISSQNNMDNWYEQYSQKYPGRVKEQTLEETIETTMVPVSAQNAKTDEQEKIVVPTGKSDESKEKTGELEYLKGYSAEDKAMFAEYEKFLESSTFVSDIEDENLGQFVTDMKLKDKNFDGEAFKKKYKEMQAKKKAFENKQQSVSNPSKSEKEEKEPEISAENAMTQEEQEEFFKKFEVSRIQSGKNKQSPTKEELHNFAKQQLKDPNLSQEQATEYFKEYQKFAIDRAERGKEQSTNIKFGTDGQLEYNGDTAPRVEGILKDFDESKIPEGAKDSREAFVAVAQEHGATELEAELLYQDQKEKIDQTIVVKDKATDAGSTGSDTTGDTTGETAGDTNVVEEVAETVADAAKVVAENIAAAVTDKEVKEEKKAETEEKKDGTKATAEKVTPAAPVAKPAEQKAEQPKSKHNSPWLAINCFEAIGNVATQEQIEAIYAKTGYRSLEDAKKAYAKSKKIEPNAVNVFPEEGKKPNRPWLAKTIAETVGVKNLTDNYAKLTGYTDPEKAAFNYAKTQFRKASKETLQKLSISSWKELSAKSPEDVVALWNNLEYANKSNLISTLDGLSVEEVAKLTESMPNGIKQFVRTGVHVRARKVSVENDEQKETQVREEPVKTEPKTEEKKTEQKPAEQKAEKKPEEKIELNNKEPEQMVVLFDRYHAYLAENGLNWQEEGLDNFIKYMTESQSQPAELAQRLWGFYKGYEDNLVYEAENAEKQEKQPEKEEPEVEKTEQEPERKENAEEQKSEPETIKFSQREIGIYQLYANIEAQQGRKLDAETFVTFAIGQGVSRERAEELFNEMSAEKQTQTPKAEEQVEKRAPEEERGLDFVLEKMNDQDMTAMFKRFALTEKGKALLPQLDEYVKNILKSDDPNYAYTLVTNFYNKHVKVKEDDSELDRG